jgi:glycosyltransferase involved in cell wall biosynthesis
MPPRVLLLTQWFDPEPTMKGMVFARELARLGFQVEVITGFPNYPGGQLYPGYAMRPFRREVVHGIRVTRVALYPSHDGSVLRRMANYASFALSALLGTICLAKPADLVYAYHPPLTVPIVAILIGRLRRIPVVLDIQDLWPDTLRATGMASNRYGLRVVGAVCRWVYRTVDRIVVLSPGFKRLLTERGVPPERIDIIPNWCDDAALRCSGDQVPASLPFDGAFRIVFAGNLGKAQGLEAVLEAARRLEAVAPAIRFLFIGDGVEGRRLRSFAADCEITNVAFMDRVSPHAIGGLLQQADALLVHLRADPLFSVTIPSKTQAYMAIGKPILMAVAGDAASLVAESGCGVLATPDDPDSIAEAALALHATDRETLLSMGARGRAHYQTHLSLSVGVARFANVFRSLMPDFATTAPASSAYEVEPTGRGDRPG